MTSYSLHQSSNTQYFDRMLTVKKSVVYAIICAAPSSAFSFNVQSPTIRVPGKVSRRRAGLQSSNLYAVKDLNIILPSSLPVKADILTDNDLDNASNILQLEMIQPSKNSVPVDQPEVIMSTVWKARLLLLLAASLYGTNFTFVKILDENIPLEIGTALRFTLAAAVTLPVLLFQTNNEVVVEETSIRTEKEMVGDQSFGVLLGGAEIGLWNFIGYISQAIGLQTTPASTSAFICSLAVVIVPILDFLAGKKILSREIIGAVLAVVGIGFLELDGLHEELVAGHSLLSSGTLYSLIQPIAFGIGFWRMEHYTRKYPTGGMQLTSSQLCSIASLMIMSLVYTSGGIGGLPDASQFVVWLSNPTILGAVLWTGVITTALTVFIETIALKTLSAAETTMVYSTEPIFGSAFAATMLGESMGIGGAVGAALVLGGCLFSNLGFGGGGDKDEE